MLRVLVPPLGLLRLPQGVQPRPEALRGRGLRLASGEASWVELPKALTAAACGVVSAEGCRQQRFRRRLARTKQAPALARAVKGTGRVRCVQSAA